MQLVFDRIEADALLGNEKGQYGPGDLNRVEQAVEDLVILAKQLDIHLNVVTKTNWDFEKLFSAGEWPVQSQMERYIKNIHILCDGFGLNCPLPLSMQNLDWEKANQIEEALNTAYLRVQSILDIYKYSGELIAGEEFCL